MPLSGVCPMPPEPTHGSDAVLRRPTSISFHYPWWQWLLLGLGLCAMGSMACFLAGGLYAGYAGYTGRVVRTPSGWFRLWVLCLAYVGVAGLWAMELWSGAMRCRHAKVLVGPHGLLQVWGRRVVGTVEWADMRAISVTQGWITSVCIQRLGGRWVRLGRGIEAAALLDAVGEWVRLRALPRSWVDQFACRTRYLVESVGSRHELG